jgi:putative ABC transport system permease protein
MRLALRIALLELHHQSLRLLLIALALATGFAAFFATYGFSGRVLRGVASESKALLGGDLVVQANGLVPEDLPAKIAALPAVAAISLVYDFPTMASGGTPQSPVTRLVEMRAVEGDYPLAGRLEANPGLTHPFQGLYVSRSLADAWKLSAAPANPLLDETLLGNHQALRLGTGLVPIRGILTVDDSQQATAFSLGPRVILDLETARTLGLVTPRARLAARILALLKPGEALEPAVQAVKTAVGPTFRVQGHLEAANALSRPVQNLTRFVQLLGLFTLILAAMGAWAILTSFLENRTREAAILRCLGSSPSLPVLAYGLLASLLLLTALAGGLVLGTAAASALPSLLGEVVPTALRSGATPRPPLLETGLALLALGLLLLPAFLRLATVRPLAMLREGPEPKSSHRSISLLGQLGAAVLAALLVLRNAPTLKAGLGTVVVLAVLLGGLFGLARLLVAGYRRLLDRLPLAPRLGLGQLGARPGLSALLMSVMGLAVFLILASQFVKDDLIAPLASQRGAGRRPNLFLVDVPPEALPGLKAQLERASGHPVMEGPIVRGRLLTVGGQAARQRHSSEQESRPPREQNLSWRAHLAESEQVVAGAYWPEDGRPRAEASLDQNYASELGAKLGDELVFDIQGQELRARVTSLRKVRWATFQVNFFILLHPSLLEGIPALHVMAAEVDDAKLRAELQTQIALQQPSVTLVDVAEVVARVERILDLIALVARTLAGLMLTSALLVLGASLLAGRAGRARDIALLRAIGASNRTILQSLWWEFLALGASAATLAGMIAYGGARIYATQVLELESHPDLSLGFLLVALSAGLTLAVGLTGSRRVLRHKPLEVLREE